MTDTNGALEQTFSGPAWGRKLVSCSCLHKQASHDRVPSTRQRQDIVGSSSSLGPTSWSLLRTNLAEGVPQLPCLSGIRINTTEDNSTPFTDERSVLSTPAMANRLASRHGVDLRVESDDLFAHFARAALRPCPTCLPRGRGALKRGSIDTTTSKVRLPLGLVLVTEHQVHLIEFIQTPILHTHTNVQCPQRSWRSQSRSCHRRTRAWM